MSHHVVSKYFQSKVKPIFNKKEHSNEDTKFNDVEEEMEEPKRQKLMITDVQTIKRPCQVANKSPSTSGRRRAARTEVTADLEELSFASKDNCCTPLEQVFLDLKRKHSGNIILLIETGYLFRFFAEDAEIASRVLHMNVFPGHNLCTNSIPMQTLQTSVRRLVACGHKVGVVKKVETALMKLVAAADHNKDDPHDDVEASGWNSNGLFRRELTDLYTKATLIDEDFDRHGPAFESDRIDNCNYLMCIYEIPIDSATAVCPLSGDMVQDHFLDGERRQELECRFAQIRPIEIVIPDVEVTDGTLEFIEAISRSSLYVDEVVRVERLANEHFTLQRALESIREFYSDECEIAGCSDSSSSLLSTAMELEPPVLCCLSALLRYLRDFKLEYILKLIILIRQFTSRSANVFLDSATVRSLELFWTGSGADSKHGNLHRVMNRTMTAFGSRLFKTWIGQPLRSKTEIERRHSAVSDILSNSTLKSSLTDIMKDQLDLESGITAIFHKKCSCRKYWKVVSTFVTLKNFLTQREEWIHADIESPYLKSLFTSMSKQLIGIEVLRQNINYEAACKNDEQLLFVDWSEFPDVAKVHLEMSRVESKLMELVSHVNQSLGINNFQYSTYNGKEYVILMNSSAKVKIPSNWITIARSNTKICYQTPEMHGLATQMSMLQQHLLYECHLAWQKYLDKFKLFYQRLRQVVSNLAILDCLTSFATLADQENLIRPCIVDCDFPLITITGGYHPVVSKLQSAGKCYIRNDTELGVSETNPSCFILSGSNMGGKSCYSQQVALIALMAQMGSYVPADSAVITPLDAIYVRSGVHDCIMAGKSSFFVEASDVASIMNQATSKSLVVLDGFGHGTSDSDGAALVFGVLRFCLEEIKCLTIAITHFSEVASALERVHPTRIKNYHMSTLVTGHDAEETVTYLYQLEEGISEAGYARNVAKLAGIDDSILNVASVKSHEIELKIKTSRLSKMSALDLFRNLHHVPASLNDLRALVQANTHHEFND